MSRVRSLAAGIAAAVALAAAPVAATAQSLTDALIAAYNTSNLLDRNRALLRAADEDVVAAMAALRPLVGFVAQATAVSAQVSNPVAGGTIRNNDLSGTLALSADITLFDFGRNRMAVEAANGLVLALRQGLIGVEQTVLLSAVRAFMDVRAAVAIVDLRENNVRLIGEELRAARDRFEVGEITRTDVAIAESRLAAARSQLAAAQGDLAVAREAYNAVTGAYPGTLRTPPGLPQLPRSLPDAQALARERHPAIRQAQQEVAVADLNVAIAVAAGQGQLSAGASLSVNDEGRDTSRLSLTFRRDLYTGGRQPALQRRAMASRDATRAGLHQQVVDVLQEVGRAWSNLDVAVARIRATDLQIAAAQTAFEGVRQEAELGARTTLDVLNAEQELLDARAARVEAETSRYIAHYAVLASVGLLTVEHLNLGIPVYDPAARVNTVREVPARSRQGDQLDRVMRRIGQP